MKTCAAILSLFLAAISLLSACSSAPSDSRIGVIAPNASEEAFGKPVGNFLGHRCGSLDCHGQPGRNLRIWSCEGMRFSPNDVSICKRSLGGASTTEAEHQATYRSIVGLEPAVMSEVVANHGRDPELLTFVRKPRGTEAHKGGKLFEPGDDQDVCVTSWLSGRTNLTACNAAFENPVFPPLPGQ